MPLPRWDVDNLPYGGAARFGGWLGDGIEVFDAAAFGIAPQEALLMDAQHRVVLEASAEAIYSACGSSLSPAQLTGAPVVVAIGIASSEYNNWVSRGGVLVSGSAVSPPIIGGLAPWLWRRSKGCAGVPNSVPLCCLPHCLLRNLTPVLTGAEAPPAAHHRVQCYRGRP